MTKSEYVIVRRQGLAVPDQWVVVYGTGREAISQHETEAGARAAITRYNAADKRRAQEG